MLLRFKPSSLIEDAGEVSRDDVRKMVKQDFEQYEMERSRTLEKTAKRKKLQGKTGKKVASRISQNEREIIADPLPTRGFTFIDLFAGIGGYRIPLEKHGGDCVFSSEIDRYSKKTYQGWFGETPHGDITDIPVADIPDHDILAAGFPCQPFSIAGVSKKISLGHAHGFDCNIQGTLFFSGELIST